MKLNRYNYEEYFILYMDNELSSDDRREVEIFLQENPDLKAEMDMLLQSKLAPDTDINFNNKGSLMQFGSNSISMTNYEEWLLSYIDDELDNDERNEVEKFLAANPGVQKELSLLQRAKLQPEAIVFPNKELLYRREEKVRVIAIKWWRIAAAAVVLIGILAAGIVLLNNKSNNDNDRIVKDNKIETPVNNNNNNNSTPDQQSPVITSEDKPEIANVSSPKNKPATRIKDRVPPKEDDKLAIEKDNGQSKDVKKEELIIVQNPNDKKPDVNPRNDDAIAGTGDTDEKLTNSGQKTGGSNVTGTDPNPSDKQNEA
ncbi:MAG TPA: hypothetical protein VI461_10545, partial [Chitinophagaceae bacterium]|nr:hypothetical protein [Chitinophagaceae bacterium]